jgi:hypothetical protein
MQTPDPQQRLSEETIQYSILKLLN